MPKNCTGTGPREPSDISRFFAGPRYLSSPFDENELPPLGPPRSATSDFARCGRIVEVLEYAAREILSNGIFEHPEIIDRWLAQYVKRGGIREPWHRSSRLSRYLPYDTHDPMVIFGEVVDQLVSSARRARTIHAPFRAAEMGYFCDWLSEALRLKSPSGIDVRFDVLEALLLLCQELRIQCGAIEHDAL